MTDAEIDALARQTEPPKFVAKSMPEAVSEAVAFYEDIYNNKGKTGLRTGFKRFDSITGGLKKGWFMVVVAETNIGKSTFALNLVNNVISAGRHVALFSFEMEQQEIIDMLFSLRMEINRNHFNTGYFTEDDFRKMKAGLEQTRSLPLTIFDDPNISITDAREACLSLEDKPALVVIDYLQLVNSDNFRDNREQQVAFISRKSKALAKELGCPVVGLSQLNEEGKVRESRSIAHDANVIIKLCENDEGIDARVTKGRGIPKGTYRFEFRRELCQFTETACDDKLTKWLPREP